MCQSIGEKDGRIVPIPEVYEGFAVNNPGAGDAILAVSKLARTWAHRKGLRNQDAAATRNALEYGNIEKIKVQESDSLSTVSVLLLPAIMSLFPLALFQEASLWTTLVYAAATDIFSVLPVAFKGIELVVYGSRKHYSHVTDVSGLHKDKKTLQYAHTWVSMCKMKPFVRRRGVCYVKGAVTLMLLGIFLEFWIKATLSRKEARTWRGRVVVDDGEYVKMFHMPE